MVDNYTHTLNINNTSYPIYSEGLLVRARNDRTIYPLMTFDKSQLPGSQSYSALKGKINNRFIYYNGDDANISADANINTVLSNNGISMGHSTANTLNIKLYNNGVYLYDSANTAGLAFGSIFSNASNSKGSGLSTFGSSGTASNLYLDTSSMVDFVFKYNSKSTALLNCKSFIPYINKYGSIGKSGTYTQWHYIYSQYIYKNGMTVTTSDERYKDFIEDIDVDFNKLKSIPKKKFTWKEGIFFDDNKVHFGTSAQKVKEIYPELIHIYNSDECNDINDEKAILGVDYEKLSLVALTAIDKLYDKLNNLKKKLNGLKLYNEKLTDRLIRAENRYIYIKDKLKYSQYG